MAEDLPKHILVVEDDLSLGFLLMELLEGEGYSVKLARDVQGALQHVRRNHLDLCLLDIMLPDGDGFQLARQIRMEHESLPFMFLTARSLKEDRLQGYKLGADDYITKPFDEEELLCKIQVILRRNQPGDLAPVSTSFQLGDYTFDYARQELRYRDEAVVRITEKESEVLRLLCLHRNQILRRDEAVEQIYGEHDYFLGRSFDVFISHLRKYLNRDPRVQIENVFRVGFILNVPE